MLRAVVWNRFLSNGAAVIGRIHHHCVGLALATVLGSPTPAQGRERVVQLAEDGVQTRRVPTRQGPLADAPVTRVCEAGARWLRLDFTELNLRSYDSLVLASSGGDRLVFQGERWNGRSFSTRALRGA